MTVESLVEKPIDRSRPMFNGSPWIPWIALDEVQAHHNCQAIPIDIRLNSQLDFQGVEEKIQSALSQSLKLFFILQLDLDPHWTSFFCEARFATYRLGLNIFREKILVPHISATFAVAVDCGGILQSPQDPLLQNKMVDYFLDTYPSIEDHFGLKPSELFTGQNQTLEREAALYQINILAEYLHRLLAAIQEPIEIYALMTSFPSDCLTMIQAMRHERFPHLRIGLKNCSFPFQGLNITSGMMFEGCLGSQSTPSVAAKTGLVVPPDAYFSHENAARFQHLIHKIISLNEPIYLLYEETMTENWQNLEQIIVDSRSADRHLIRKCQGFAAASGRVIYEGDSLGVWDEMSWLEWREEVRGRGI